MGWENFSVQVNWEIMIQMNIDWDIYEIFVLFHFKMRISKMKFNNIINNIGENFLANSSPISVVVIFPLVSGQSPADAESNYLRIASTLDMYGVELHKTSVKVSNTKNSFLNATVELHVGICARGITVFQNSTKIKTFAW